MTKNRAFLLVLCLLVLGGVFFAFTREGKTQVAADINLKGINVDSTTLNELRQEKPVYLNFWAPWCAPCVEELPEIDMMYERYGNRINFAAVAVHAEGQDLEKFVGDKGFEVPIYQANAREIVESYRLDAVPASLLISTDGTIIAEHLGGMNANEMEEFLAQAL